MKALLSIVALLTAGATSQACDVAIAGHCGVASVAVVQSVPVVPFAVVQQQAVHVQAVAVQPVVVVQEVRVRVKNVRVRAQGVVVKAVKAVRVRNRCY